MSMQTEKDGAVGVERDKPKLSSEDKKRPHNPKRAKGHWSGKTTTSAERQRREGEGSLPAQGWAFRVGEMETFGGWSREYRSIFLQWNQTSIKLD